MPHRNARFFFESGEEFLESDRKVEPTRKKPGKPNLKQNETPGWLEKKQGRPKHVFGSPVLTYCYIAALRVRPHMFPASFCAKEHLFHKSDDS